MLQANQEKHTGEPGNATDQTWMGEGQLAAPGMGIDTPIRDTRMASVNFLRFKRAIETVSTLGTFLFSI
jgi:hypothetical protein